MIPNNGTRSLADALNAAIAKQPADGANPLVDRLATALAVTHAEDEFDDDADELDLPMLVQGERYGALVVAAPAQRLREGRAALIGFGLGLILLVPIGVVMSGRVSDLPPPPRSETVAALETYSSPTLARLETPTAPLPQPAPVATFTASIEQVSPAPEKEVVTDQPAPPLPAAAIAPPIPKVTPLETSLAEAQDMISHGEIDSARASLRALGSDHEPAVVMLLAETYDPNMLAAWSARGTAPDVAAARALYQRALALGQGQARQRLQALE